ncbi:hypothetical protein TNCV_1605771 [Trichonephila clavipes]|nr:hypothetical protein TNCV_1605771 [Trichonephila clavipes]
MDWKEQGDVSKATASERSDVMEIFQTPQVSVVGGKLPARTTQPTSRIGTLTSTFAGLKEDMCSKDSLAAAQR